MTDPVIDKLLSELHEALRNWRLASEDVELFRSNGQDKSSMDALKRAMEHQSEALQRCVETVEALAKANRQR